MSLSIYWWPNPITRIPYIPRDGYVNPEINKYDHPKLTAMAGAVETLSLAFYFTGKERYAQRAAVLLRTWFLDEKTRMNPNLNYSQHVPGLWPGTRQGVIDTVPIAVKVMDSVGLLAESRAWSESDNDRLRRWFVRFLEWLQHSPLGKAEARRMNNHGMWYDVQVARYALFVGKRDLARRVLDTSAKRRIAERIRPDGSQPEELRRTKSFNYSLYNLNAMFALASMAQKLEIDLWGFQGNEGQGIRKALDYLADYIEEPENWPYKQVVSFDTGALLPLLRRAAIAYGEPRYEQLIDALPGGAARRAASRTNLLYPKPSPDGRRRPIEKQDNLANGRQK